MLRFEDEMTGEIVVTRDPFRSCVELHFNGTAPNEYRVVRLARHEARRLAALVLFQSERLESARERQAARFGKVESKSA